MNKKMWKVICPIEKKDGSGTHWARLGVAYGNKDDSINLYLDSLPMNGKLQLREWSEEELRERDQRRAGGYQSRGTLSNMTASTANPPGGTQEIPF